MGRWPRLSSLSTACAPAGSPQTSSTCASSSLPYLDPPDANMTAPYGGNLRTGLGDLDAKLGGLNPSDLIIVAARTGVGKTSTDAQPGAQRRPLGMHAKVAVFSLEMAGEQLAQRLLASESRIDSARLRLGLLSEVEESRMMNAHGILSEADIYVDDSAMVRRRRHPGPHQAPAARPRPRPRHRRLPAANPRQPQRQPRAGDQLHHASAQGAGARAQRARHRRLAALARHRAAPAAHPELSDLRECGSIEQDADVVLFIYREDVYTTRDEWEPSTRTSRATRTRPEMAQLIIAKHRNGPTGVVEVRFRTASRSSKTFSSRADAGGPRVTSALGGRPCPSRLCPRRASDGGAQCLLQPAPAPDRRRR